MRYNGPGFRACLYIAGISAAIHFAMSLPIRITLTWEGWK